MMRMRLMQRPQITTLALPRSHTWPSDLLPPHQAPFHFLPDVFSFAKFMLATPAYLISDLTRDLDELSTERRLLLGMNDELGILFVDGAHHQVRNQIAKVAALDTSSLKAQIDNSIRDQQELEEDFASRERRHSAEAIPRLQSSDIPEEFLALKSIETLSRAPNAPLNIDRRSMPTQTRHSPKQRRNVNPPPPSTSTYYYYQAASGLPIFLHPLDIRILLSHFHNYSSFPDTVTIRIESFSEGTVNDELRKRCKYLGHMPEGADVVFIEADLEGVVGADGLKNFEGALKMRTSRRKEKGRKDDRARARAEEREKEKNIIAHSEAATALPRPAMIIHDSPEDPGSLSDESQQSPQRPQLSGAWGARSFASALHSTTPRHSSQGRERTPQREMDELDVDEVWHELERDSGVRKKRGSRRLVVLGSGAGGGRR